MKNVAVILARGGSKGIPSKNIVDLCGKPLIYYAIKAAILSDVSSTWVSTDSEDIAKVATEYDAKVLMRPAEYAEDSSPSELALIHFCQNIKSKNVVFIQPTSPLVSFKDINNGLKMLEKYDSVFSGCKEHWVPRWEINNHSKTNKIWLNEHEWNIYKRPRRQDMEELVVENGAFYISSSELILKNKLRYSGSIGFVEMPPSRSFQVDNKDDLLIIESMIKNNIWSV